MCWKDLEKANPELAALDWNASIAVWGILRPFAGTVRHAFIL
jgi:hypothetical protein